MSATRTTRAWVGGAALGCTVLLAGGWFVLVSPVRADAALVHEQTASAQDQNGMLEVQLASLEADSKRLDEFRTELETIRTQVPATLLDTELVRQVEAAATASGVHVKELTVMTPSPVVPVAPIADDTVPAPAPAPVEGEDAGDAVPLPTAPVGPVAPDGMIGVDLSFTVSGNPDAVSAFVAAVQESIPRLVLVTGLDVSYQEEQGAEGGAPAVVAGDWLAVVRGTAYVLLPATEAEAAAAPAPAAAPSS